MDQEKATTSPSSEVAVADVDTTHLKVPKFDTVKHDDVDIHNSRAFKGNDSDGKVDWTPRSIIAAIGLGMLYSGSQCLLFFVGGSLQWITKDLHAGPNSSWLPVSYTLATTAAAPFAGYIQDMLGRRGITIFGAGFVIIGAILMGTAHTFGQGVVGMAVAGGSAVMTELAALAGISDIVPVRQRGISLALVASSLVPFNPYVLYCQLLGTYSTWRWGPWITVIWNGVGLICVALCYFPKSHPHMEGLSKRQITARIDWAGGVLSIVGTTLLLVGLHAGGETTPWASAYVLCQLIIGVLLLVAWVWWELKFAMRPVIPKEIFQGQRIVALVFVVAFVAGFNFFSLINFFPLSFSMVYNPDPVQVGLKGLGYGFGVTVGAVIANACLSTRIDARYILLVSATMMTTFIGSLASMTPDNAGTTVAFGTLAALGTGGVIVPSATVAMIVVPDSVLATTAALTLAVRSIGGSIGFTVYYNVFSNKIRSALPEYVAKYAIEAGLAPANAKAFVTTFLTHPEDIASAPGYTAQIVQAATVGSRWAYAHALKYVWYTSIPFGLLAVIGCLFIPSIKKFQTNRIAVRL